MYTEYQNFVHNGGDGSAFVSKMKDTIIFKRRRDFSLVLESRGGKAVIRSLPEMAIDRIRDLTAPGNRATAPSQ